MPRTPSTSRARARAELTAAIKETARGHLANVGAAGLSLRAVARDMGMVSSGIYHYFESRDALLTALIVDAFDAVGERAEAAAAAVPDADITEAFLAVATAIRAWALAFPHDYALVYGSPVPGYQAPQDTVDPAARVSLVMLGILVRAVERGEIDPTPSRPIPRTIRADLARLRNLAAPGVPDEVLARGLLVWTGLFGAISYELFGHLHRIIEDYDAFFEHQVRRSAAALKSPTPG